MSRPLDLELLGSFFSKVDFEPGEVLRRRGEHYKYMYVIAEGLVEVAQTRRRNQWARVSR
jgi:CRP-like cAMP-binding protein